MGQKPHRKARFATANGAPSPHAPGPRAAPARPRLVMLVAIMRRPDGMGADVPPFLAQAFTLPGPGRAPVSQPWVCPCATHEEARSGPASMPGAALLPRDPRTPAHVLETWQVEVEGWRPHEGYAAAARPPAVVPARTPP